MASNISDVMTIEDLSKYLKISKSTLYKLAQEGSVPGQKVGKHWRFHRDVINQWLASRLDKIKENEEQESGSEG
jgi:excisionase family DNA binding protein